jgi:hypothetical protein
MEAVLARIKPCALTASFKKIRSHEKVITNQGNVAHGVLPYAEPERALSGSGQIQPTGFIGARGNPMGPLIRPQMILTC